MQLTRIAKNITVQDLAQWKADLRRMTKIYRDVDPKKPDAVEKLIEKAKLFQTFAETFVLWVSKGPRAIKPWTRAFFVKTCQVGGARVRMSAAAAPRLF